MPLNIDKRRCTSRTAKGKPCAAWAVRATDPPTCSAHAGRNLGAGAPAGNLNRRTHGFYSPVLSQGELADLVALGPDLTLRDEIALARVTVRRAFKLLEAHSAGDAEPLDADSLRHISALVLSGTRTVARLLRDEKAISGDAADGIAGLIGAALDELSDLWQVEL